MLWNIDDICALNPYYEHDHDDGYSSGLFLLGRMEEMQVMR
jgi:hypothetical protein